MKKLVRTLSVMLCVSLVLLSAVSTTFALSLGGVRFGSDKPAEEEKEAAVFKDESVYVIASASGAVDKIIVSDWIRNNDHRDTIALAPALKDIEDAKGDKTYTMNTDNMQVWDAGGDDLYLKGEGQSPLPVDLSVSFTLDGNPISPDELLGKSGKVTIRFDYKNNQYETVEIDGKKEKIYVPFAMLTGLILDNKKFSDIEVTNGKLVSDGDRTIVAGLAFPGLGDDLQLDAADVEFPDYVRITATVNDFALGSTITVATNDLFSRIDTKDLDSIDDVKSSLGQLSSAMSALIDGSSRLYDGLAVLCDKSEELTAGVEQLAAGAQSLYNGAEQVDLGALKIDTGALDLSTGLSTLSANNTALNNGSKQTFESILAAADKALAEQGITAPKLTVSNYNGVLDGIVASISDDAVKAQAEAAAREQVTQAVEANRGTVEAAVADAVRANVEQQVGAAVGAQVKEAVLASLGYTTADYDAAVQNGLIDDATRAGVEGAIAARMNSDEIAAAIASKTDENMQSAEVKALIASNTDEQIATLIEQQMQGEAVQSAINAALAKAKAGREQIEALRTQLNSFNTFYTGLKAYTGGVASASSGASQLHTGTQQLKSGTTQLKDGSKQLLDGILTMKNGVPMLTSGVQKLKDGSMQLTDGLEQFNEQGVSRITSLLGDELSVTVARLKATVDVSKDYKSYTGLSGDMDGEVKFVYKTASVE